MRPELQQLADEVAGPWTGQAAQEAALRRLVEKAVEIVLGETIALLIDAQAPGSVLETLEQVDWKTWIDAPTRFQEVGTSRFSRTSPTQIEQAVAQALEASEETIGKAFEPTAAQRMEMQSAREEVHAAPYREWTKKIVVKTLEVPEDAIPPGPLPVQLHLDAERVELTLKQELEAAAAARLSRLVDERIAAACSVARQQLLALGPSHLRPTVEELASGLLRVRDALASLPTPGAFPSVPTAR